MMGRHQDRPGTWLARARVCRAVALAAALAACATPHIAAAAGPRAVVDDPIASMLDPDEEGAPRSYHDAEREPPPLLSERAVDEGIDTRLHRMQEGRDRRTRRWRLGAADVSGGTAQPLPPEPPPRAGVHRPDDAAD
jgi:hypothetical protein